MKTITINVSESVYRDFQEYAASRDRTTSELIREAMEEFRTRKLRPGRTLAELEPYSGGEVSAPLWPDDILDEMMNHERD